MQKKDFFLSQIKAQCPELVGEQANRAAIFAENLYSENALQNLTRIPENEFATGHLRDVLELFPLSSLGRSILDIGSGSGVPGLLAAAIDHVKGRKWILSESERAKCEYLARAIEKLGLSNVKLVPGRVEEHIEEIGPDTILARAVGTVDKIASWVWNCSTWNNIVLLKSTGWNEEWEKAKNTRFGKKLTITHTHEYWIGDKYRNVITLKRNKN